jgi:K+-transporting ATPase KdpF subunit
VRTVKGQPMTLDDIVGVIVTIGLLIYLTVALLRPEKF